MMMNRIIGQFVIGCLLLGLFARAECDAKGPVQVRGYHRKDGTYVAPHTRSAPGSGSKSSGSSYSGSWTPPSFSPTTRPRTGYRTSARSAPRTAAAGSSLNSEEEPVTEDDREIARSQPKQFSNATAADGKTSEQLAAQTAADLAEAARLTAQAAEREQQKLDAEAKQLADEEETKASTRLKRIKQLIAEKKGVISSNMKDSLREIIKKYPKTEAAKEAKKLLAG